MRVTFLIISLILNSKLFAQELFYSDNGLQSRGYSHVDTIFTTLNKIHVGKASYVFKRLERDKPYIISGADTITLPQTIILDNPDSIEYFILYNSGNKPIKLLRQDGSLISIKEATNYQKKWLPVEFWSYSWCGNSYFSININPGQLMIFGTYKLRDGMKTTMRLRLKSESNGILVSETFESSVNTNYFELNSELKKYLFGVTDRFSYLK